MTFTVPNHAAALFEDQSEIDSLDWQIILDALRGSSVRSGCQVSPQVTPDGSVLVSAGTFKTAGSGATRNCPGGSVSVVSGSANPDGSTALAADANWARYDLIVINSAEQLGVVHGTTDPPTFANGIVSNPVFPAYTGVVLAAVYVTPGLTAIATGYRTPKDVLVDESAFHDRLHLMSSTTNHSGEISNAQHGIRSVASAHGAGQIVFTPVGSIAATDVQAAVAEVAAEYPTDVVFSKQGTVATATGKLRWYNDTGRTLTFVAIRASVDTAPTGATLIVDVNRNGTTIYTTQANRPAIAISGNTIKSTNPDVTTVADGQYLTVDVDQVGSTIPGSDLTVVVSMKG